MRELVRLLNAAFAVLALAACGSIPPPDPANHLRMNTVAWSPDGRRLAFDYCRASYCGMGVLDVESDAIRLIDNPPGFEMESPAFSNDGRRLAFVLKCHCGRNQPGSFETNIAIYELDTGRQYPLTIDPKNYSHPETYRAATRRHPMFMPNSDDVLYVSAPVLFLDGKAMRSGFPDEFVVVDRRTLTQRVVASLPAQEFYSIDRPAFLDGNTIIFSGLVVDREASDRLGLRRFGTVFGNSDLPYAAFTLRFGSDRQVHHLTHDVLPGFVGYVAASLNGRRIVFTNTTTRRIANGHFSQSDVFMYEGGRIEQISGIAQSLHSTAISRDGSRVAVLSNRGAEVDELFLVDVDSRAARHVPLRDRLLRLTPQ